MVLVRNIQKEKEIIKFDYFPEGETASGYIEFNFVTREIVKQIKTQYDIAMDYAGHAVDAIERYIMQNKDFPSEICEIWY